MTISIGIALNTGSGALQGGMFGKSHARLKPAYWHLFSMKGQSVQVGATQFKARCLQFIQKIHTRKGGKPCARLAPIEQDTDRPAGGLEVRGRKANRRGAETQSLFSAFQRLCGKLFPTTERPARRRPLRGEAVQAIAENSRTRVPRPRL